MLELGPHPFTVNTNLREIFATSRSTTIAPSAFRLGLGSRNMQPCAIGKKQGPMRQILSFLMSLLGFAAPALAECQGKNLIARCLPAAQTALRAEAAKQPFAVGNFWLATKGRRGNHPRRHLSFRRSAPCRHAGRPCARVLAGPRSCWSKLARKSKTASRPAWPTTLR